MYREPHRRPPVAHIDPAFRLAGLVLILVAVAAICALIHLVQAGVRHPATIAEFVTGATGFAAASAGTALLLLGKHLLDPVAISERRRDLGGYRSLPIRR